MEEGGGGWGLKGEGGISQCIKVLYKRVNLQKSKKSSDSDYFLSMKNANVQIVGLE